MSYRQLAYLPDRRSTRINHSVLVTVKGVDAHHAPYSEEVCTVTVSCHGCSYESRSNVLPSEVVTIEPAGYENRSPIRGRVRSVKPLGASETRFEVAVELESPENVWGVAFPPEDWLPRREAKAVAVANPGRELRVVPRVEPQASPKPAPASKGPAWQASRNRDQLPPLLAQLAESFGQHIQEAALGAVKAAIAREKGRLLSDLRAQLQEELTAMLKRGVAASADELARRSSKVSE